MDYHLATLTLTNFLLGGGKGKPANPSISELGKMRANFSKYDYRVTLRVKNDGSRHFCADYHPLNAQT
jgi:hypothetical protein